MWVKASTIQMATLSLLIEDFQVTDLNFHASTLFIWKLPVPETQVLNTSYLKHWATSKQTSSSLKTSTDSKALFGDNYFLIQLLWLLWCRQEGIIISQLFNSINVMMHRPCAKCLSSSCKCFVSFIACVKGSFLGDWIWWSISLYF